MQSNLHGNEVDADFCILHEKIENRMDIDQLHTNFKSSKWNIISQIIFNHNQNHSNSLRHKHQEWERV